VPIPDQTSYSQRNGTAKGESGLKCKVYLLKISKLTDGRGADLVFDATYIEPGFVETAKTVRQGGSWIVLGVGPGKTTRTVETLSPVDSILAERGARHVNVNLLRYFSEPATLDDEAKAFLQRGLALAME